MSRDIQAETKDRLSNLAREMLDVSLLMLADDQPLETQAHGVELQGAASVIYTWLQAASAATTERKQRGKRMSYCPEYAENVKEAVRKLIDLTYQGKFRTLTLDTDEDFALVRVWIYGKSIKVQGWKSYGPHSVICPSDEDELWSFLECCQRALVEIEKTDQSKAKQ